MNKGTWTQKFEARQAVYRDRAVQREIDCIASMDAAPRSEGLCYFFATDGGLVKIGYSTSVWQRLSAVRPQTIYNTILAATARGGWAREKHYHRMFAEHREFGEWFRLHDDIIAEIERLRAVNPDDPTGMIAHDLAMRMDCLPPARLNTEAVA
jgi:hypothetical protein